MPFPDTEVYDLLQSPPLEIREAFVDCIKGIERQEFELKKNYLSIDLADFYCFNLAFYRKQLVAFSGMQRRPLQPQFARVNNRLYITPEYRADGLSYRSGRRTDLPAHLKNPSFNLLLPAQISLAKQLGLSGVFISREKPHQIRMIQNIVDNYNSSNLTTEKFQILDDVYNVVSPEATGKGCWQKIILMPLKKDLDVNEFSSQFLRMNLQEFNEKFQD